MKETTEYFIEVIGHSEETENDVPFYVSKDDDEWLTKYYEDAATYDCYSDAEHIVNTYDKQGFEEELKWEGLTYKESRIYSRAIKLVEVIKD